jgi:hypothetical protein
MTGAWEFPVSISRPGSFALPRGPASVHPTRHRDRGARVLPYDDYLVVVGSLRPDEREYLCLTHVEYGRLPNGGTAWFPKEVPDVAA